MANKNDFVEMNDELKLNTNTTLDELESKLYEDLDDDLGKLEILKEQNAKIGNPEALGDVIKNVIWEQFQSQIGLYEGEKFVKENDGFTLDLRNEAHIQTTENFAKGKIAKHNHKIDYEERYKAWQENFQRNDDGSIRTRESKAVLRRRDREKDPNGENYNTNYEAREYIDKGRPSGTTAVNKDHTISAAEIIRDPEANAHLDRDEHKAFANSDVNLVDLDSSANHSKGDRSMTEWLDSSNEEGKKPTERFNIDEDELRKRDEAAREEYKRVKEEGKKRSIETGKQSQKEEAFRISKSAARAVVMQLLADFVKEIVSKLVKWFKSKGKKLKTLIESIKDAIRSFIHSLKKKLLNIGNTLATTILRSIVGPIMETFKKLWIFLKQGWASLKQAIDFLRSPEAKNQPFEIVMLEVGKIIMGALTAGGAIILGEVIEKVLTTIPGFGIQIPILGSLANILGIFLGAVVAGIIGAIALNLIDRAIAEKQKQELQIQIARQSDVVVKGQVLKTWKKLESAYEAVGTVTEQTVKSFQESVQRERNSLNQVDDALNELDAVIGK